MYWLIDLLTIVVSLIVMQLMYISTNNLTTALGYYISDLVGCLFNYSQNISFTKSYIQYIVVLKKHIQDIVLP